MGKEFRLYVIYYSYVSVFFLVCVFDCVGVFVSLVKIVGKNLSLIFGWIFLVCGCK